MMPRHLILSLVLLTNTSFAQTAGLNPTGVDCTYKLSTSFAQTAGINSSGFDSTYKLKLRNAVSDKNFYLLSLFQQNPEVRKLLSENKILKQLANDKLQALSMAANCHDVGCFDQLLRLSGPTIDMVSTELEGLAKRPELKMLAADMRRSGAFIKYSRQSDTEMLIAAWKDAANGMNRLLSVYCLGKDPVYKEIDKVSFDVSSEAYRKLLKVKLTEIKLSKDALFFEPTLNFALKLLEANRRDEAGRYEPLEEDQVERLSLFIHFSPGRGPGGLGQDKPDRGQKGGSGCTTIPATQSPINYLVWWPRSSDADTFLRGDRDEKIRDGKIQDTGEEYFDRPTRTSYNYEFSKRRPSRFSLWNTG